MTAGRTHPLRKGTSSSTCILLGRPSLCSRSAQSTRTARAVKTCNWTGPAAAKRLPRQGETAALRTWAGTSETGPLALEPRLQPAEAVLQEKLYLRERAVAAGNQLPGALCSAHPCLRPTCVSFGRQHGAGHQFVGGWGGGASSQKALRARTHFLLVRTSSGLPTPQPISDERADQSGCRVNLLQSTP